MKKHIKGSLKVFTDYCVSVLIFVLFLYMFLTLSKESFYTYLPYYSLLIFILTASLIYTDMKALAIKEKRPQYELHPYPLKGLVYGIAGFLPLILLELIYPLINYQSELFEFGRLKHVVLNTLMGPLYVFIRLLGGSVLAYVIASLVIPAVSALGYLAGMNNIDLGRVFRKYTGMPEPQPKKRKPAK